MNQPHEPTKFDRRTFLGTTAALALTGGLARARAEESASSTIVVGVMGCGGRGTSLAQSFAGLPETRVAYVCDADQRRRDAAAEAVSANGAKRPDTVDDFRRILDDSAVDVLVIAAPDHWHGPATILGCQAGKHVYVEKPASHNPREGEWMVEAARRHDRRVQLGTQRRSWSGVVEAIEKLREGAIGKVLFSRGWYNSARGNIGFGKPAPTPEWLDYALWQGPAPAREYRDNVVHYNWHWFWHWGTGELGNNGIHALDLCRWGLGVDYPTRVTSGGGKYFQHDDQETPDTHVVTFDFDGKCGITWEARSWHRRGLEGSMFGAAFYGDAGSLVLLDNGYKIYDAQDKEVGSGSGSGGDKTHLENFLAAIRGEAKLAAEIEEGHKSTMLCHLGNIAQRTGRTLNLNPETHQLVDDAEAQALWQREYQEGWKPTV